MSPSSQDATTPWIVTSRGLLDSFRRAFLFATLFAVICALSRTQEKSDPSIATKAAATLRLRPDKMVNSLSWSADGRLLASSGFRSGVEIRDVKSGQLVKSLVAIGDERPNWKRSLGAHMVAFAPDGRHLAVGDHEGVVDVWDVDGWRKLASLPGADPILALTWTPDGRTLAIGSDSREVCFWDVEIDRVRELPGSNRRITRLAITPDGRTLATGGADGVVRVWDPASGAGAVVATVANRGDRVGQYLEGRDDVDRLRRLRQERGPGISPRERRWPPRATCRAGSASTGALRPTGRNSLPP